jgi:hypothetical protein
VTVESVLYGVGGSLLLSSVNGGVIAWSYKAFQVLSEERFTCVNSCRADVKKRY